MSKWQQPMFELGMRVSEHEKFCPSRVVVML